MKRKSLLELELSIPKIDLIATRTILGGYDCLPWNDPSVYQGDPNPGNDDPNPPFPPEDDPFDDGDWDWDKNKDWDWDKDKDWDNDLDKDRDDDRPPEDYNRDEEQEQEQDYINPYGINVQVPRGDCVIGSIAAGIQAIRGGNADEAIDYARNTLNEQGVDTRSFGVGIHVSGEQVANALVSLGFVVDTSEEQTGPQIADWFNEGGFAIGILGGFPAHHILLYGFDSSTMMFNYYDSTLGRGCQISILDIARPGNGIILFRASDDDN